MGALFLAKKKIRRTRSICIVASVVVSFMVAEGCSKTNLLTPLQRLQLVNNQQSGVTVNFCTDPAVQQNFVEKMIIILDHSGSNQKNYQMDADGDGGPLLVGGVPNISSIYATDPLGTLRYGSPTSSGTLLSYLQNTVVSEAAGTISAAQNQFALIDFNANVTTYPANSSGFTSDATAFYNYVLADKGSLTTNGAPNADGGSTDYLVALNAAQSIITNDIDAAQTCAQQPKTAAPTATCPSPGVEVASSYVIVFASDGSPISSITITQPTFVPPAPAPAPVVAINYETLPTIQQATAVILPEVQSIMALAANTKFVVGINLFTVYYYVPGNVDLAGEALLGQMAKLGNGIAYSAVSGTQLNYAQFLPPARTIKYTLSDIFVTNASTLWWSDGTLHPDTDMDGLPDDIETKIGSNPNVSDTIGNGISDSVEYRLSLNPIVSCSHYDALGFCTDLLTQCSGISHSTVNGKKIYVSSDPDGLNDCEKTLLADGNGGINNPDSNDDVVPDWLEFINNVPFQIGAPSAATVQADGTSAYNKIKNSLPTNYPLGQLLNLKPANYDLTQVSTSGVQDCYNLVVTGLPVIGSQNTVRVDVVEKSELLQDSYLYRRGKKQFPVGSLSVEFNDWNDATEKTLGTWSSWP